jgi:single-stranded DNA-specific DHH superfamily exonuclease
MFFVKINPFLFKEMDDVVDRLVAARDEAEQVLVFGDRDADGITSTVILVDSDYITVDSDYTSPAAGKKVTHRGIEFRIVAVGQDPAGSHWILDLADKNR